MAARKIPAEPLTILELAAFMIARELLRGFEGTVLWTGIESLRAKLERDLPADFLARAAESLKVFHVASPDSARYASRPRMLSALSSAISDCREIEVEIPATGALEPGRRRLQPVTLIVDLPRIRLAAWEAARNGDPSSTDQPVLLDLDEITKVKTLDTTFAPRSWSPAAFDLE